MKYFNYWVGHLALALVLTISTNANAIDSNNYATVVRIDKLYKTEDRQECRVVTQQVQQNNDAGAVLGAIAGAAIGNQIGKGGGRDVATVVGGIIGYNAGKGPDSVREEQRTLCTVVPVQVEYGDRVWFKFRGREFHQDFTK